MSQSRGHRSRSRNLPPSYQAGRLETIQATDYKGDEGTDQASLPSLTAEFVGTAALTMAIVMSRGTIVDLAGSPAGGLVGVALTHMLALTALAAGFGPISGGHLNPGVTAGFMATGRIPISIGITFMCIQLIGGIVGGLIALGIAPNNDVYWAAPLLGAGVNQGQAFGAELIGTAFLVMTIFNAGVSGQAGSTAYLAIGMSLGLGVLAFGPVSNACLNPARALGAAVAGVARYDWAPFWLYIIAPLLGGIIGGLAYNLIFESTANMRKRGAQPMC